MDIVAEAGRLLPYMTRVRRHIHAHPELGFEEHETTAFIADELSALGIPFKRMEPTGVLGEIQGGAPGKTVLLRADIDALPIAEKTGLDYASRNEGVSHACGHDVHSAMLLGAAKLLLTHKDELRGTVKLLFQPAEETGRGSCRMIEQRVLDGVDACFAEHILAQQPVGCIMTGAGQVMAGAGTFKITVKGRGCHGAMPETGADALLAGAAIVTALQSLVSRDAPPIEPLVVTVGTFQSGSRYNVVAGLAEMEGTVRAFDRKLLAEMGARIERVAGGVAAAYKCSAEATYAKTCESLITDAAVTEIVQAAARRVVPDKKLVFTGSPAMGSEDFAEYSALVPCGFAAVGFGGEHPMHSEKLVIDESAMVTGAALHAQFALDYLAQ